MHAAAQQADLRSAVAPTAVPRDGQGLRFAQLELPFVDHDDGLLRADDSLADALGRADAEYMSLMGKDSK